MAESSRPHPPQVYRRRRIVVGTIVLLILLGLVALGVWIGSLVFGGDDEPQQSAPPPPSASASVSGSPSGSASASASASGDTRECRSGDVAVEAVTDQDSYAADEDPVFELRVTNTSDSACQTNVGSSQQDYVVSEVADDETSTVFATSYCQVEPDDQVETLQAGQAVSSTFTWERIAADSECSEVEDDVPDGTYQLVVSLGETSSSPATFTLTAEDD
ncbi:hypothetical protein DCC27_008585 [Auritidibacter sp. NML130574]|uniref:hypothetical protein n=1 Tax=Auritidibacter sp. NML130574 TaxID=2170745 RepID=UPI000D737146|nr:hypothetical protein [Auritidibacter sp. NML130574]AXR74335.1 hypothetical protein DCC27_008585 [Auritidibacter sp. NML130574]